MSVARIVWVWLPVGASMVFGLLAPTIARRIPPRLATYLLSLGSAVLALSTTAVLALVVASVAGQFPAVAAAGNWSSARLVSAAPFERGAALVAGFVLALLAGRALRTAWRVGSALVRSWLVCRRTPQPLVVVEGTAPSAYAIPGWPGRIVASRGLIDGFAPRERRAVLAHEQAHLDGRHDLHLAAGALASAIDPLLGRVPAALRLATERWADEAAASVAGDRRVVARTLASAALAAPPAGAGRLVTLAAAAAEVPLRVAALLAGPPRRHPASSALAIGLVLAAALAAAAGVHEIDQLFDSARRLHA